MNKEVSDALYMLLHCALKDKEFETQKEQFEIVYKYIEELNNKINKLVVYIENDDNFSLPDLYSQDIADRIQNDLNQILKGAKNE